MRSKLRAIPPPTVTVVEPAPAAPITSEVVDVTPELAAKWLEKNHDNNRAINWRRVDAFANDMRGDAWKLTHQAICFDAAGVLIDGQHRLHAVVRANVVVKMLVIRNSIGSYYDPIDRVGPRSVSTIMGVAHRDVASLNVLRMLETGFAVHTPMTLNDAEGVRDRHEQWITLVSTIPGHTKLTGPVLAALAWALPCGQVSVFDWATKAATGEMIGRGHPSFAFRNWRERNKRASSWEVALAALNCLRYHMHEKQLASVTIGESGYRAFCARRRALKIPNTPGPDMVPAIGWVPSRGEDHT